MPKRASTKRFVARLSATNRGARGAAGQPEARRTSRRLAQVPFTGSHPGRRAAFGSHGPVPSALVIGRMIPDLPYFVVMPVNARTTHTVVGALMVDVVLGLA